MTYRYETDPDVLAHYTPEMWDAMLDEVYANPPVGPRQLIVIKPLNDVVTIREAKRGGRPKGSKNRSAEERAELQALTASKIAEGKAYHNHAKTPEERQKRRETILRLSAEGHSIAAIARFVGISDSMVSRIARGLR